MREGPPVRVTPCVDRLPLLDGDHSHNSSMRWAMGRGTAMDRGRPTTTTTATIDLTKSITPPLPTPPIITTQHRLALRQVLELHEPQYLEELRAKRTELAVGFCNFPKARVRLMM